VTIDDNSNKVLTDPKCLAAPESGGPFHISPELIPFNSEKCFLFFIDRGLISFILKKG
jgi:hypothetical protein